MKKFKVKVRAYTTHEYEVEEFNEYMAKQVARNLCKSEISNVVVVECKEINPVRKTLTKEVERRVINFRAWDTTIKCMDYDPFISEGGINDTIRRVNLGDCILMQYTGLKDKNGIEIYEGDILNVVWATDGGRRKTERMTVVFKSRLNYCGFWPFVHFNAGEPEAVEVIGNIYENPKLLKQEKKHA